MKGGQWAVVEGSGRCAQELGCAFGPEQRNPADPSGAEQRKHRIDKAQDRDHGYVRGSHTRMVKRVQGRADGRRLARDRVL